MRLLRSQRRYLRFRPEPALPAAAEAAPVPLAAQDPDTRAPHQVCYRWRSPQLNIES
jgi:hypothetical protein